MYCTVDLDSDLGYQVPGRTGYRTHPFFNEEIAGQSFLLRLLIKETQFSHPPAWVSKFINKETDISHALS
jgi:hypothetical protein